MTYHLVDGYGGSSWCGKPWHDVQGVATVAAVHKVNCSGCKSIYNALPFSPRWGKGHIV